MAVRQASILVASGASASSEGRKCCYLEAALDEGGIGACDGRGLSEEELESGVWFVAMSWESLSEKDLAFGEGG